VPRVCQFSSAKRRCPGGASSGLGCCVVDQLPVIVGRVVVSLGVGIPAQLGVEPPSPLVRVHAALARLRKARFDLRQPLLGQQPSLFRLRETDQPASWVLLKFGHPVASALGRLACVRRPRARLRRSLNELLTTDFVAHRQLHHPARERE
jgi:hypothetical protein